MTVAVDVIQDISELTVDIGVVASAVRFVSARLL
jgi:hypothetical protein